MIFEFKFPDIGEGVHEGKVLQLNFKNGDKIEEGNILATVETDKVVAEIPTPKSGVLKKFGANEGQIIHVGEVFAFIELEGNVKQEEPKKEENAGVIGQLELSNGFVMPSSGEGIADKSVEAITLTGKKQVLATPVARKMASDLGIDISKLTGSGPGGRIMKADISAASQTTELSNNTSQTMSISSLSGETKHSTASITEGFNPQIKKSTVDSEISKHSTADSIPIKQSQSSNDYTVIPMSVLRQTIARNMQESHSIPAAVIQDFVVIDELIKLRKRINDKLGEKISFQPFFIKALASALKKFPILNTNYDPVKQEIHQFKSINIGVAVDTEYGLMVPVIKNVESKSIYQINEEMKNLVDKAKKRTISLEDLKGGTFTVTNYGPFGGVYGKPMIMPPQTAIIGFGRMHEAPVVKDGNIVVGNILPLSMPFDHRVVDGATAGSFLTYFMKLLNDVDLMMIV